MNSDWIKTAHKMVAKSGLPFNECYHASEWPNHLPDSPITVAGLNFLFQWIAFENPDSVTATFYGSQEVIDSFGEEVDAKFQLNGATIYGIKMVVEPFPLRQVEGQWMSGIADSPIFEFAQFEMARLNVKIKNDFGEQEFDVAINFARAAKPLDLKPSIPDEALSS